MIPGDMLTEAQRRCIPDVSFELIPIRNLVSNQEYQRPLSENHIRKALEEFDVYQINPVKVSRRDGINYVFDGQHTIEIIASESGSRDTPVWCMIYDDLKYKEEAHIFADQQKHVKGRFLPQIRKPCGDLHASGGRLHRAECRIVRSNGRTMWLSGNKGVD